MNLVLTTLEQGFIYGILAMGVYLSFKILNIPDMSVEGTFPLGALFSSFLLLKGVNPILATFLTIFVGIIPGIISALLSIKLKIIPILAGILTMTMLYSVNLRINGSPNVPITKADRIFDIISTGNSYVDKILILLSIVIVVKILIDWFLSTKMGYMLITTGDNEDLVKALGESPEKYKIIGLALANGLVALSGALFAQSMRVADSQMGVGSLVTALASIIIGDTLFRTKKIKGTNRAVLGAIIYKIIGTLAIEMGLNPHDLKLINGLIVIIFIAYNNSYGKIFVQVKKLGGKYARN